MCLLLAVLAGDAHLHGDQEGSYSSPGFLKALGAAVGMSSGGEVLVLEPVKDPRISPPLIYEGEVAFVDMQVSYSCVQPQSRWPGPASIKLKFHSMASQRAARLQ